jgi:hypothetical protein
LAKEIITFVTQAFRPAMARAGGLIYMDLLSKLIFQIRFDKCVLNAGKWWRAIEVELVELTNDAELASTRHDEGVPLLDIPWTFNGDEHRKFVQKAKADVNIKAAARLRSNLGSNGNEVASNKATAGVLQYMLRACLASCRHYGESHLEGGEFHPVTLQSKPEVRSVLLMTRMLAFNSTCESLFGIVDRILEKTSHRMATFTVGGAAMAASDNLTATLKAAVPGELAREFSNAKKKVRLFKHKAQQEHLTRQKHQQSADEVKTALEAARVTQALKDDFAMKSRYRF